MCDFFNDEKEPDKNEIPDPVPVDPKKEERKVSFSVADKTLLVIDAKMPWVADYDECLAAVSKLAQEHGCDTLAINFKRPATEYFLEKKGWKTVKPGIMEYVPKQ